MEINYSDFVNRGTNSTAKKEFKVGYFNGLENVGDEVFVRFDYATPEEFKIVSVHTVKVGNRYRKVSCLKGAYDPVEKCPLCASGNKVSSKVYLKLLEYSKDENGNLVSTAKVWERPASFTKKIVGALSEAISDMGYPAGSTIRDVVFKIKCTDKKPMSFGSGTYNEYEVRPTNPAVHKPELYAKKFDDFAELDLAHHSYMERTSEEISEFLKTGEFPKPQKATTEEVVGQTTTTVASTTVVNTAVDSTVVNSQTSAPRRYTF